MLAGPATPERLAETDGWLASIGEENLFRREYLVERLWLSDLTGRAVDERGLSFIKAVAEERIQASAPEMDMSSRDPRLEALEAMLAEMRSAGPTAGAAQEARLGRLLTDDLSLQREEREAGGLGHPHIQRREDAVHLPSAGTLYVLGDTHGDQATIGPLADLLRDRLGDGASTAVFLGDYVHNGLRSSDMLETILSLRAVYPQNVVLLSGNHEFHELWRTAAHQFFVRHWRDALACATGDGGDRLPPHHYGHLRLDLARRYGLAQGESLYQLFADWGMSLPYVAHSRKGVFMCHSIAEVERTLKLRFVKDDAEEMHELGYSAWQKARRSLHCRMIHTSHIKARSLAMLRLTENQVYVMGHMHPRSGDRDRAEGSQMVAARPDEPGALANLCSTPAASPDAGYYMAEQYGARRGSERDRYREGTAFASLAAFEEERVEAILPRHMRRIGYAEGRVEVEL